MPLALNRIIKDPRYRARPSVRPSVRFPLPVTSSRKDPRGVSVISRKNRGFCRQSNTRDGDVSLWRIAPRIYPYADSSREEFDSHTSARKKRFSDKQHRSRDLRTSIRHPCFCRGGCTKLFPHPIVSDRSIDVNSARSFLFIYFFLIDGFSIPITFQCARCVLMEDRV